MLACPPRNVYHIPMVTKTPVVAVSGLKNSGKTTLIEALIPLLAERGVRTAVIKHHGHGFGDEIPDRPGTDTYRFLQSGACGTVVFDAETLMCVKRRAASTDELIEMFSDADLILLEGFKDEPVPRVEMLRKGQSLTSDPATLVCAVVEAGMLVPDLPKRIPTVCFGDFRHVAEILASRFFSEEREEPANADFAAGIE